MPRLKNELFAFLLPCKATVYFTLFSNIREVGYKHCVLTSNLLDLV